ncbi:MAG: hypothetical protein P8Y66_11395 [Nitrospirota bacterium]|jgi:uncharacterized protein (TIGR02001 family)
MLRHVLKVSAVALVSRTLVSLALVSLALAVPLAGAARAVEKGGDAEVAVLSNYVWRGLTLSDDWVVQPAVGVTYGPMYFNLWSNYDTDPDEVTETDLTVAYTRPLMENLTGELGYIYYALEGVEDTQEFYLSLSYDWLVTPSLTFYYDFDEGTGGYLVLALEYERELSDRATLNLGLSGSVLFDNAVVGVTAADEEYTNLHNGELSGSLSVPLREGVVLEPMLAFSFPLSGDFKDATEMLNVPEHRGDDTVFYGGATVSVSF